MSPFLIEFVGYIGTVLIVGSYAANILGKIEASSKFYIWANFIGGLAFVVYCYSRGIWPNFIVNVVWVVVAIYTIFIRKAKI